MYAIFFIVQVVLLPLYKKKRSNSNSNNSNITLFSSTPAIPKGEGGRGGGGVTYKQGHLTGVGLKWDMCLPPTAGSKNRVYPLWERVPLWQESPLLARGGWLGLMAKLYHPFLSCGMILSPRLLALLERTTLDYFLPQLIASMFQLPPFPWIQPMTPCSW